jgi:hypothetical protein
MTYTQSALTNSSVISRESVWIAFLIAASNDLQLTMFDVGNGYLNAPTTENAWTEFGIE